MDAFESLVATLLRRDGYWIWPSFKVGLTKEDKVAIGKPSSPRWEIDLVAYKGSTNEVLAIECKSYLDSGGVLFRKGVFDPPQRYKLFSDARLRDVVLDRLVAQLQASGSCALNPRRELWLVAGHVNGRTDRKAMDAHFTSNGWRLCDDGWVRERLIAASAAGYENDVAHVVAKLLLKKGSVAVAPASAAARGNIVTGDVPRRTRRPAV